MSRSEVPSAHRQTLAAYLAAGRHLLRPGRAKTQQEVAEETGMCAETLRRWLRRDHYDTYLEYWAAGDVFVNELASHWQPGKAATSSILIDLPDPNDPRTFDPPEDER